ncbi:rhodanese-like domain-containing protein [Gilvimarinus agarilyticus]|uniref:rhodanese-like domain-containing protein n=1 Tax=unclassified Gilvimarinus TaxID=2642066 RepID=UPI001C0912AF|nr:MULTISPECIES: rhodanese-like domain-containing protein [unclassified Gilvimarinus]MBU2885803.1 rhodanese-like domain-containing protein [Gilvimarinus agarilyticus]MDO6570657.1 rhodanese-like domain-containing protein [Gilvimarinus sp. 2_MG-2023]MDO6746678.1 rhodanese-like domain-containing protein [Gilvimarinus sp. 1_MG-2023]
MNNILIFVTEQWLLVGTLAALVYLYAWRERLKNGQPITTSEATALINAGSALFVDVRDGAEFKAGHITGAVNLPYSKLADQSDTLEEHRDKTLILVDKMGQHAGSAGRQLGNKGYTVCRLSGGISEWQNQNLPLVKK